MVEITLIPKKEKMQFSIEQPIFVVALALLILVVLASAVMFIYKNSLENELQSFKEEIQQLEDQRDLELEKSFFSLRDKILYGKPLLETHTLPSKFFEFLEKNTYPNVQYLSTGVNFDESIFNLKAQAANLQVASYQLDVLEKNENINKVEISQVVLNKEGMVNFDLTISFVSKLFRF